MRLVRFMSKLEFFNYVAGNTIENHTRWRLFNKSDSVGVCFFPEDPAPEERLHYLSGVVDFSVVTVFRPVAPIIIRNGIGKYRDPREKLPGTIREVLFKPIKMMEVEEYSLDAYNKNILQIEKVGRVSLRAGGWKIEWLSERELQRMTQPGIYVV